MIDCCPDFASADDDPVAWSQARRAEGYPMLGVADHLFLTGAFAHVWVR